MDGEDFLWGDGGSDGGGYYEDPGYSDLGMGDPSLGGLDLTPIDSTQGGFDVGGQNVYETGTLDANGNPTFSVDNSDPGPTIDDLLNLPLINPPYDPGAFTPPVDGETGAPIDVLQLPTTFDPTDPSWSNLGGGVPPVSTDPNRITGNPPPPSGSGAKKTGGGAGGGSGSAGGGSSAPKPTTQQTTPPKATAGLPSLTAGGSSLLFLLALGFFYLLEKRR